MNSGLILKTFTHALLTLLGLKSAKFANASPAAPELTAALLKGSEEANGSFGNPGNGSGLFGCLDGDFIGDFGGAGLGGGAFFCFGGKAGRGDSVPVVFDVDAGAKGSLPNKSPPGFYTEKQRNTVNVLKFRTLFFFLFSNKMMVIQRSLSE